jgi:hypothetical protein
MKMFKAVWLREIKLDRVNFLSENVEMKNKSW